MPEQAQTDRLAYLIAKLHRFVNNGLESRLQEQGFSVEQWRVLETLSHRDGCPMGELANAVLMNHPALTKMIDRMVSSGLVHRAPDPADQRRVLVYGTERGIVAMQKLRSIVAEYEGGLSRLLDPAAMRDVGAILDRATNALAEQD
ncbi:MAG: MarR family transcriptional regulator [Rhizobiaceae bacterium]|nr:MarR family transcriptional regulator [Rhizobiaceae bacterium]